jgi:hypothetical protein
MPSSGDFFCCWFKDSHDEAPEFPGWFHSRFDVNTIVVAEINSHTGVKENTTPEMKPLRPSSSSLLAYTSGERPS